MAFNMSSIKTTSNGLWQGENPLQYAFPLLIIQTILVIVTSRIVALLLKPLRQPLVVAEILGGIILGPSALGRNKQITSWLFPSWSTPILESVSSIGLLYFLFLVGLELDLNSIRKSGKRALSIAVAGISLPFLFGIGLTFLLRKALTSPTTHSNPVPNILFIGISLSITAFPVLARILAELKLLTTGVGETAMAAAALNDVVAWILLALAVALAGGKDEGTALTSIWILISGLGFIALMMGIVRPVMRYLIRISRNGELEGSCVVMTLAGVMISGLVTDLIGIHSIFGAFIFGIIVPKEGGFARKLRRRIEDFVTGLLLPLYFASNGLKTDVAKIQGVEAWGILALVISTACAGKILGTFLVALMCTIPVRESLALGVLMNTKGLVELIVLNIGRDKKVLDDEMFAILVMMALFTTFMTTPAVMAIYKPHNNLTSSKAKVSNDVELRLLACIRGPGELPSLIALINSCNSTKASITKVYVMRLVELTDRSSSIVMVQRTRKNGLPCIGRFCPGEFNEQISASFDANHKQGPVKVRPATSISKLTLMHDDISHIAEKKRSAMIILPFHKQWKREDDHDIEVNLGQGWRGVNERVLANAKCSIGVLIDRGFGVGVGNRPGPSRRDDFTKRVCVAFLGGPDSRGALQLGGRMADHSGMRVTVITFCTPTGAEGEIKHSSQVTEEQNSNFPTASHVHREEQERDETTLLDFIRRWDGIVTCVKKETGNIVKELLAIAQSTEFELMIVGKGKFSRAISTEMFNHQVEYEELGPIGGLLASSQHGINCSILVIQQHDSNYGSRSPQLKWFQGEEVSVDKSMMEL